MSQQKLSWDLGLNVRSVRWNVPTSQLIETSLKSEEGVFASSGALITFSGKYTGRSPNDKFVVNSPDSKDHVWWGNVNKQISEDHFDQIYEHVKKFLAHKDVFVTDCFCGADPAYRLNVRFVTRHAWHAHFVRNMFIDPNHSELQNFVPDYTVINASGYFEKNWKELGLNSDVFVLLNLEKKLILIGGTEYSGEMKKSIFSVMNYLLPLKGVMPMHCSANKGKQGDTVLFFGLSGTGKTTLSTDKDRYLIGDDEHGWSDRGVFNFEGGCYAKCINLSQETEPEIWDAIKFGSILENVDYDSHTRVVDFTGKSITENTRVSYPIDFIHMHEQSGQGNIPNKIIFLTCDAFGVIPPVSILTPDDAGYHFLSGYTAKVAGTERGITEPKATFSTCFGSPFMVHYPKVYADLLAKKMRENNTPTFLVNTGWIRGPYGEGQRIKLSVTRQIVNAIIDGSAETAPAVRDDELKLSFISQLPGIDDDILDPSKSWSDKQRYAESKKKLVGMFHENYKEIT